MKTCCLEKSGKASYLTRLVQEFSRQKPGEEYSKNRAQCGQRPNGLKTKREVQSKAWEHRVFMSTGQEQGYEE